MWDRVGPVLENKFGILIFFAYDTLVLGHNISPTKTILVLALVNPNAPLSIQFCIKGTFRKIVA
jgi:hypothetical protein